MPHSWIAYEMAERITISFLESGLIKKEDELKVRGIIQIILEDNVGLLWLTPQNKKEVSNERKT